MAGLLRNPATNTVGHLRRAIEEGYPKEGEGRVSGTPQQSWELCYLR